MFLGTVLGLKTNPIIAGLLPKCVIELKTATLYILLVEIVPIKLSKYDYPHYYLSINIYNAFFIIEPELLNDVYNKLKNNDYPVSTMNDINKFIDNTTRILLVNNIQINDIYNNIVIIKLTNHTVVYIMKLNITSFSPLSFA